MPGDPPTLNDRSSSEDLRAPGRGDATLPLNTPSDTAADFPAVAGYEILSELGRGAMGVVYKARHVALNRTVALKMLHAVRQRDAEQRLRFRNEVEIIARLQHPGIVQVYDVGEHEGRPFFTMEYLGGGSLADQYQGQPQPAQTAAELIETLARAMHAVHARGIVHRDLKPSNVVRTADGAPKITDFGLARQTLSDLTLSGAVLGTPSYMAPEQAAGHVHAVGPTADVYALGAILYELITGRPPFRGVSVLEVVCRVQDSEPVAPRRMEPRIPRDLETICLKCLRKEPGRRYGSAAELADDLQRFRSGESILARPPAWPERLARWSRRRPGLAVLLAAVAFAAWVIPLALLGHTVQLEEALGREHRERERAHAAEELARRHESAANLAHFAADLKLASTLFNNGDVFQLPLLLEPYRREDEPADDPRGFAWWYLRRHAQKAQPALAAHDGAVHLLEFTEDGRGLVTAGGPQYRQTLKVWDRASGRTSFRQALAWEFAHADIDQAAFAPQAGLLAAIGRGETVVGWSLDSPQPRFQLQQSDEATYLALSPDGRRLAVSGRRGAALWDCAAARLERTLATPPRARLAFAPDGELLMAAVELNSFRGLQWWEVRTGELRGKIAMPQGVRAASYSPRGRFVLVIDGNGNGAIWDAQQRLPLHWSPRIGAAVCLTVSADERKLAAGDGTGQVRLWDMDTGEEIARNRWQPNAIVRLAFSPDQRILAAANAEGQVQHLDATARHLPHRPCTAAATGQALVWSADGEMVAVAAEGGTAYLFDRRRGDTRAVLRCPVQDIRCLAFAADGRTLAVVCQGESVVRLWDIADGRWRAVTASQPAPVTAIAFDPESRWLAALAGDSVHFWDATTAASCGVLAAARNTRTLAFTPEGASLLTAGATIQVWDIRDAEPSSWKLASTVPAGAEVACLALCRAGRHVALGGADGSVRLWKLAADRRLTLDYLLRPPGGAAVGSLAFTPDAKTLLISQGGHVDLWDLSTHRARDHLEDPIILGSLAPDGRTFAAIGPEKAVRLWEAESWRVTRPRGQALEPVRSLLYTADGQDLLTAGRGDHRSVRCRRPLGILCDAAPLCCALESLRRWDCETGREQPPDLPSCRVLSPPHVLAHSADGRLLAAGAEDGGIFVWDWEQKERRARLFISGTARFYSEGYELTRNLLFSAAKPEYAQHSEGIAALAFSADGQRLAAAGTRGSFRIWQMEDGQECCRWREESGSAWLAFAPDGTGVAGSRGGQVCIWDANTGQPRSRLGSETDSPVRCGAFVPGKTLLVLGSTDGAIRLWDPRDGCETRLPGGHPDRITALAFTPDGKTLASAGWDRTVRLWNLRAGREVAALEGHQGRIHALAFSPDGRELASGGEIGPYLGEVLFWRR